MLIEAEIVGQLARGGMAELLLARVVDLDDRLVVLKRILPRYANDTKVVDLFLEEARLLARLDHPSIPHLVDFGMVDADYVIAIEYVHGQDLRSILRRAMRFGEPFPLAAALQIARDVAAALHHAHERRSGGAWLGIVHRDVSPSNIMVSYAGDVKLVDFGVAKTASNSTRERAGTIKGTIQYMSPEQVRGAPVDRRSDVFSLGIVLWEMITMRRLFQADDDVAVIQKILRSRPVPPSQYRAGCPPELDRITAKALAYAPEARYQNAGELARDLDRVARQLAFPSMLHARMQRLFEHEIGLWDHAEQAGRLEPEVSDELSLVTYVSPDEDTAPDLTWLGVQLAI